MAEAAIEYIYQSALGTVRFARDSAFWITTISGQSAVDVDISATRGPGQAGSSLAGQSVEPRELTIDGCLFDPVEQNRQQLLKVMAPREPATLTRRCGADAVALEVVPRRTPEISQGDGVQNFQLRLYAAYPYWRSAQRASTQLAGLEARLRFPFYTGGRWYLSRFSGDYFHTLRGGGNVPTEFELVFAARAPVLRPEVMHMATRRRIGVNGTLNTGEQLTVSTIYGHRGAVLERADGTTENGFAMLSVDSDLGMALQPGDNLLRIDAEAGRQALGVRLLAPREVRSGV